jgi:hypothetical protein
MSQTNRRSTPTKTTPVLQHLFCLFNTFHESMEQEIHLLAKYHPSYSHYIELSIGRNMDLV